MNIYLTPKILFHKFELRHIQLQGSTQPLLPIQCTGSFDESCTYFGRSINVSCDSFAGILTVNAFIEQTDCSSILNQCTITIDGESAETYCNSNPMNASSQDCASGCAVEWECHTSHDCSEAEFIISCPGYQDCSTIPAAG